MVCGTAAQHRQTSSSAAKRFLKTRIQNNLQYCSNIRVSSIVLKLLCTDGTAVVVVVVQTLNMAKHNLCYSTIVHCQATHQSQHGFYRGQLTHICSKACGCRDVDFVCSNACSAHPFTAVAFREISSTARRKLLLAIEIHMTLRASGDAQTNNRRRFTTAELPYQSIVARWCVDDQTMAHSSRPVAHPSRTS